ncbi:unnamed protein product [Paramecium primaurelia]|uniref:Uncharacterized protein n=1 Tax=Paramecium primaurelia TaxID=5886 RepID=A0A8S1PI05_PARPR|nr:unnamed protein product [Paramecium primaurelia]
MGCCQHQSYTQSQQNFDLKQKSCLNERKIEPLRILVIGDSDRMEIMDEGLQFEQTSLKEIQSPNILKFPSESVIIDLRSGTSLASPIRRKSSKNLNQKFIEML